MRVVQPYQCEHEVCWSSHRTITFTLKLSFLFQYPRIILLDLTRDKKCLSLILTCYRYLFRLVWDCFANVKAALYL